ncbi:hypothetical protein GobsT_69500 [Gemmata obscuriglobus]|nr:hypothetical protein GobsT_69500 [Gemmata obscuriglobus]VTS11452.1 transposase : Integrase catalytic region OS=Halothermothrix orenii (strain H 168 / OCM 544 / DSM 9562) GN=Hore_13740 PE=4 SV=1 [Gemmata obscuriglobus UQM 2246]
MRGAGIAAKTKRKFRQTIDPNHGLPVAENRLARTFDPDQTEAVWVADITDIPTREGRLYLAAVEDLLRRVALGGWMDQTMTSRLVVDALEMALARLAPTGFHLRGWWLIRIGGARTRASTTSGGWRRSGSRAA